MIIAIRGLGGAIGSTLVLGTALASRNGDLYPQYGSVLGLPKWRNLKVPELHDIKFDGWDISGARIAQRAKQLGILHPSILDELGEDIRALAPRPAPVRPNDVEGIIPSDQAIKMSARSALDYYTQELQNLKAIDESVVSVNLASTEYWNGDVTSIVDTKTLFRLIEEDSPLMRSGLLFGLASIEAGIPYCDFTPDLTLECPAVLSRAEALNVPVAGKDGNTGQTFLKLILAEMLVRRNLKIVGWYSTNVLGNLDGKVLSLPGHKTTKMRDKLNALDDVVPYQFSHVVDIAYEESRGDFKESWDSVHIRGWLDQRISLRVNWHASDSILAAPIVLDLARLLALDAEAGQGGVRTHLSPFFKRPIGVTRTSLVGEFEVLERYYGI